MAAEPKRGGRLRLGLAGSVEQTLDPGIVTDAVNQNINYQLRDTLVEVLPDLTVSPELFESWDASPDAREWKFNIRQGVEFHNGKTLDAEDVIYSLEIHRMPESKSSVASLARLIEEMKPDGKGSVVMKLTEPNSDFPVALSDYHFLMVPAGTTNFDEGMGTGPYMLESFEAGVRTITKRNPNYWRDDRGFFDEVETLTILDANARTSALLSGEVDHINRLDLKTVKLLEQNSSIKVMNISGLKHFVVAMTTNVDPFNSADARLAMKWGIDRQAIVDNILSGYGAVGNDHPISTHHRFFNKDLPQRDYDPDKAMFHLKKAGLEDATFQLHAAETGFDGAVDAMVLFQQDAAKAGMNIELVREPIDGYWSRVYKKVPFFTSFWSSRPSEDMILTLAYSKDSNFNETGWANERFNELLVTARGELDEAKRRDMYYEMQQLMHDDSGSIVPVWLNHLMASSPKIGTREQVSGAFENDGHRCAARWWFNA